MLRWQDGDKKERKRIISTDNRFRIKMSSQEFDEWIESLTKADPNWKEAKFPTECWYLALQAHHLSILPCIRRYQRRIRALR
jgi:ubiquitin conjugation factor E4 B